MTEQRKPAITSALADIDGTIRIQLANGEILIVESGFDTSFFKNIACLPEVNLAAAVFAQQQQILLLQQEITELKNQLTQRNYDVQR